LSKKTRGRRELLVGCGAARTKDIKTPGYDDWTNLTTLDFNSDHGPDVVWDLNDFPYPFDDNEFDEVHAYEVLEHIGTQGDFRHFFKEFEEYWRILKPGGLFCAHTPVWDGVWAWGDPGHTRVISEATVVFLVQDEYKRQVGHHSPMSDYRFCYAADFEPVYLDSNGGHFFCVIKVIK